MEGQMDGDCETSAAVSQVHWEMCFESVKMGVIHQSYIQSGHEKNSINLWLWLSVPPGLNTAKSEESKCNVLYMFRRLSQFLLNVHMRSAGIRPGQMIGPVQGTSTDM